MTKKQELEKGPEGSKDKEVETSEKEQIEDDEDLNEKEVVEDELKDVDLNEDSEDDTKPTLETNVEDISLDDDDKPLSQLRQEIRKAKDEDPKQDFPPSSSGSSSSSSSGSSSSSTQHQDFSTSTKQNYSPKEKELPLSPFQQAHLTLSEAFPTIEPTIVRAVLIASSGLIDPAFNGLLSVSDSEYVLDEQLILQQQREVAAVLTSKSMTGVSSSSSASALFPSSSLASSAQSGKGKGERERDDRFNSQAVQPLVPPGVLRKPNSARYRQNPLPLLPSEKSSTSRNKSALTEADKYKDDDEDTNKYNSNTDSDSSQISKDEKLARMLSAEYESETKRGGSVRRVRYADTGRGTTYTGPSDNLRGRRFENTLISTIEKQQQSQKQQYTPLKPIGGFRPQQPRPAGQLRQSQNQPRSQQPQQRQQHQRYDYHDGSNHYYDDDDEDDKEQRSFFDDDLPQFQANLQKGFNETKDKVNSWVENLKKKIDNVAIGDEAGSGRSSGNGGGFLNLFGQSLGGSIGNNDYSRNEREYGRNEYVRGEYGRNQYSNNNNYNTRHNRQLSREEEYRKYGVDGTLWDSNEADNYDSNNNKNTSTTNRNNTRNTNNDDDDDSPPPPTPRRPVSNGAISLSTGSNTNTNTKPSASDKSAEKSLNTDTDNATSTSISTSDSVSSKDLRGNKTNEESASLTAPSGEVAEEAEKEKEIVLEGDDDIKNDPFFIGSSDDEEDEEKEEEKEVIVPKPQVKSEDRSEKKDDDEKDNKKN